VANCNFVIHRTCNNVTSARCMLFIVKALLILTKQSGQPITRAFTRLFNIGQSALLAVTKMPHWTASQERRAGGESEPFAASPLLRFIPAESRKAAAGANYVGALKVDRAHGITDHFESGFADFLPPVGEETAEASPVCSSAT
jgi:hypothetical protein